MSARLVPLFSSTIDSQNSFPAVLRLMLPKFPEGGLASSMIPRRPSV